MTRWLLKRVALLAAAALVAGAAAALWLGAKLVAPAPFTSEAMPSGLDATRVEFKDALGRAVRGFDVPAHDARGVIVMAHGIRGNRWSMVPRAEFLSRHGYASVLIDLQAHGESEGERITLGATESLTVAAAVDFTRKRYPGVPIAVLGISLGGAAAALAQPLEIDALILESVFPDVESAIHHRVRARLGPLSSIPSWLLLMQIEPRLDVPLTSLRPVHSLHRAPCPVLVMGGAKDPHTPAAETRRLFEAAPPPGSSLWMVPEAGHVDLHRASPGPYEERVLAFLNESFRVHPAPRRAK